MITGSILIEAASIRAWNDGAGKAVAIFGAIGVVASQSGLSAMTLDVPLM